MNIDSGVETLDRILGGALSIVQPISGYRFSIEAILLGDFAKPRRNDRVLELGAGCGVVAAMLAHAAFLRQIVALESQPGLAKLAARTAALNHLNNLRCIEADLRSPSIPGLALASFDYVVANPPYRAAHSGRISPDAGRRIARAEGDTTLGDFLTAAARYVSDYGKVAIVFTALRAAELMVELKGRALEPKRLRFVHPYADRPATTILIEARKHGGTEVTIEAPLIVWRRQGVYTAQARQILAGNWSDPACQGAGRK
jgi:tRNA1Val (adenine37-N6)-methyltransferase